MAAKTDIGKVAFFKKTVKVKKTSTGLSTVTISASAGTIDGATTTTLTTQYSSYTFISDGSTNWWII